MQVETPTYEENTTLEVEAGVSSYRNEKILAADRQHQIL